MSDGGASTPIRFVLWPHQKQSTRERALADAENRAHAARAGHRRRGGKSIYPTLLSSQETSNPPAVCRQAGRISAVSSPIRGEEEITDAEGCPEISNFSIDRLLNEFNQGKTPNNAIRDLNLDEKLIRFLRHSVWPISDCLDPFAALPIKLNRFQDHLISLYLLYYPMSMYELSPRLLPHPVASNFSIAMTIPASFQIILAWSALYRISLKNYSTEQERKSLELAIMRYKGDAMRMTRLMSTKGSTRSKDDLPASIIALGTFERRSGSQQTASMHYRAVRQILKSTGGPLTLNSALLSRLTWFFECIYATNTESCVWEESEVHQLVLCLNDFLKRLLGFWQNSSELHALTPQSSNPKLVLSQQSHRPIHSFILKPGSVLLDLVASPHSLKAEPTEKQRLEMIIQISCLLTLAVVTMDFTDDLRSLQLYMDRLHESLEDLRLVGQSCNNVMWQIQVIDNSDNHTERLWRAASHSWVVKHYSFQAQSMLRDFLLAFFKGKPVGKSYQFDPYQISRAN